MVFNTFEQIGKWQIVVQFNWHCIELILRISLRILKWPQSYIHIDCFGPNQWQFPSGELNLDRSLQRRN